MIKPEDLCIRSDYQPRIDPPPFDDTGYQDQWQSEEYRTAANLFSILEFKTVLDWGCGSAYKLLNFFPKEAKKRGVEVGDTLNWLKQNHSGEDREWMDPAAAEGTATDMLLCVDVIEHQVNPLELMVKLSRINFKIGFISTPDRDVARGNDDVGPPGNKHHSWEWTKKEFFEFVSIFFNIRSQVSTPNGGQLLQIERRSVDDVTIIVKTFCRPNCIKRLVDSIRKFHPAIPIIIADDGNPYAGPFDDYTTHLKLPYDCGLKMGRNLALALVRTKYFLLCDDDFVYSKNTSIKALVHLAEHFNMTIMGGDIRGITESKPNNYRLNLRITNGELVFEQVPSSGIVTLCDKVANFYLANTDEFRMYGAWDSRIKIGGHEELFLRFKRKGARVGMTTITWIIHEQHFFFNGEPPREFSVSGAEFEKFRNNRVFDFWVPIAMNEYGITRCLAWEPHGCWKGYEYYKQIAMNTNNTPKEQNE